MCKKELAWRYQMSIFSSERLHASAPAKRRCKIMAKIRIPEEALPALQIIAKLDGKVFESLLSAIKNASPTLDPSQFPEQIDLKKIGISEEETDEIFSTLIGLYMAKENNDVSSNQLSEDIGGAISELKADGFDFSQVKIKLVERLKLLLGFDKSLGVTAKAMDVLTEQERTYCSARILTDIRPVFTSSVTSPSGAMIIHNLQIRFHSGKEHEEFYFALDTNDIKQLKSVVERAEEKAKALQTVIETAKLPYLKP